MPSQLLDNFTQERASNIVYHCFYYPSIFSALRVHPLRFIESIVKYVFKIRIGAKARNVGRSQKIFQNEVVFPKVSFDTAEKKPFNVYVYVFSKRLSKRFIFQ